MSEIRDHGSAHKYFSMIPHTMTRGKKGRGLSLPARWLYIYLKSITGDDGFCSKSTSTIVEESQLSRGAVTKAKAELVKARLIVVTPRHRGYHDTDQITLVDIWPANMLEFAGDDASTSHVPGCTSHVPGCTPGVPKKKDLQEDLNRRESVYAPRVAPLSHTVPDTFVVTEALRTWAAMYTPLVDLEHETAVFMVHEFSRPVCDWPRKWQQWMLRAQPAARQTRHQNRSDARTQYNVDSANHALELMGYQDDEPGHETVPYRRLTDR